MNNNQFLIINTNVALEYIISDQNVKPLEYSIITDTDNRSKTICYNNDRQLYNFDDNLFIKYNNQSFLQLSNHPDTIPIQIDKIRIWMPSNYTFDDNIGFLIRAYVKDMINKEIFLLNYYYESNIKNHNRDLTYSTIKRIGEYQYSKYIELELPNIFSISQLGDNSILTNLTKNGINPESNINIEFFIIKDLVNINNRELYKTETPLGLTFNTKNIINKLKIDIDKKNNGILHIKPTYSNSKFGLNQYINRLRQEGVNVYFKWTINQYEKNILTKEINIEKFENLTDNIKWYPIIKNSNTTANIDIILNIIDINSEVVIDSVINTITLMNNDLTKVSKLLTKIDVSDNINITYKNKIKIPSVSTNISKIKDINLTTIPYNVYSNYYKILTNKSNNTLDGIFGLNNLNLFIQPFDNILKFDLFEILDNDNIIEKDLSNYNNIEMVFKSDNKIIKFKLWEESTDVNLKLGKLVFNITEDKYETIKSIYKLGSTSFWINGRTDGELITLYTSKFIPYTDKNNILKLNNEWNLNKVKQKIIKNKVEKDRNIINEVRNGLNIDKSGIKKLDIRMIGIDNISKINLILNDITLEWNPYWKGWNFGNTNNTLRVLQRSFNYTGSFFLPYDRRDFGIRLRNLGFIDKLDVNLSGSFTDITNSLLDRILGWFKIHNFDPNDNNLLFFLSNFKSDLDNYMNSELSISYELLNIGVNVPNDKAIININKYLNELSSIKIRRKND